MEPGTRTKDDPTPCTQGEDDYLFNYTGTQEEEDDLWNQHLEFSSTPRTLRDPAGTRTGDDHNPSTKGEDVLMTHYVGGGDHPPPSSGHGNTLGGPGCPRSSLLLWEDELKEDDFWGMKTTLDEDDEDDFWENPLSFLSMGGTPEPTSRVTQSILCNRSQGVSGSTNVPDYRISSTNIAVDDVFEDEPSGATTICSTLAQPYQIVEGGTFDVDMARVVEQDTDVAGGGLASLQDAGSHSTLTGYLEDGGKKITGREYYEKTDPSGGESQHYTPTDTGKRLSSQINIFACLEIPAPPEVPDDRSDDPPPLH